MKAYLEWKEDWLDATEWDRIDDPGDPRPCQHPPKLSAEDAMALSFFRWNCRNAFIEKWGMMPSILNALGMRPSSLTVFMMKLDMISETEARIAERKKQRNGDDEH